MSLGGTMEKKKILLVGESWVTSANHTKGWDTFSSVTFHLGAEPLVDALKESPFELTYMAATPSAGTRSPRRRSPVRPETNPTNKGISAPPSPPTTKKDPVNSELTAPK